MKKLVQSLFLMLFIASSALAQDKRITGKVTSQEDGSPLPGVSVKIIGTKLGTQTNANGNYLIDVPVSAKSLEVSFIGFTTKRIQIGSSSTINVSLEIDSKQLSEVVVVGYGTQSKRLVTSSVATITSEEIKEQPVATISQAIQGRLAGVQVTSGSGRPGAPIQINVRGRSSIAAGNDPLYVVDGVILASNNSVTPAAAGGGISALANLNPEDILSVDVLKDAAAAAIYGSRGSNGVVLITTKSGTKGGKSTVNVSTYTGLQSLTKTKDLLNASDYRTLYNESLVNSGSVPLFTGNQVSNPEANVNYIDQVLRNDSKVNSVQLSITSGGNPKTQFYTSLNYFQQDGALKKGDFKRYAIRINAAHEVNDFIKVGNNMAISRSLRNETAVDNSIYSPFPRALVARPDQPIYNTDGTFATNSFNNPVQMFLVDNLVNLSNIFNNVYGEVKILPGLKFKSSFGIDYTYVDQRTYDPIISLSGAGSNGSATSGYIQTQNLLATQNLSYNKNFFEDKLNVDATAVYEYQWNDRENNSVTGTNFPSDLTPYVTSAAQITSGTASYTNFRIESMLARLNLGWKSKYLLGASIRRDGSSKIPEAGRYGYFPSVSAGWIISEESFLKSIPTISYLKIRSSYGLTGNQEGIGNFSARRLIAGGFNYNDTPGFALNAIGSPDLKWEETAQFDIGLDISVLNDRLSLSADYYNKQTKDLLQFRPIPSTTGFNSIFENIGEINGKGFDFLLSSKNLTGAFKWNTSFNISTYTNKVTKLYLQQPVDGSFVSRTSEGQPLGAFFLIKATGVDPVTGDMVYEDLDKSNTIGSSDRQFVGNPLPDFFGGITNNFSYKGLDLGVFFQYSSGNDIYNLAAEGLGGYQSLGANVSSTSPATNIFQEVYDQRWTPSNTTAKYPRAVGGVRGTFNTQRSSRYLEDGSYLRLKNITLGYQLPKSFLNKLKVANARLFITGQNFLTFTNYTGFDPEATSSFGVENTGVDQGSIPQFKTYTFGINIGL
ncbi:MAG: TonB-dependent receptor [Opitutaceae bacterium]|nr:TonB-dependent receptor [Cytophagales bacterium]